MLNATVLRLLLLTFALLALASGGSDKKAAATQVAPRVDKEEISMHRIDDVRRDILARNYLEGIAAALAKPTEKPSTVIEKGVAGLG